LTYTWDYAWFAFAPWGWHLTNIVLHAAAAVMLFLFLEKISASFGAARGRLFAALTALIWAIHPLHTSAVCYISGRADLLAALFTAEHEQPPQFTQPPSFAARPILAARAWAEYAGLLVAPVHLHMERDVLPFGHGDLQTTIRLARRREYQTLLGVILIVAFI